MWFKTDSENAKLAINVTFGNAVGRQMVSGPVDGGVGVVGADWRKSFTRPCRILSITIS